jgi:hypothetical protein
VASRTQRLLGSIGLAALAFVIAKIGRLGLDWIVGVHPEWTAVVERVGGWLVGLMVVVVVLLPLFRLYGVLEKSGPEK